MTGWIEAIGFAMGGAMLMMSALGMALSVLMPSIEQTVFFHPFFVCFSVRCCFLHRLAHL